MENKILSLLGLCKRAGLLVAGEDASEQSIKNLKANLIIVANDSSENTKKKFTNMCQYRNIPMCFFSTKEELAKAIGKEITAIVAILDKNFADKISVLYKNV